MSDPGYGFTPLPDALRQVPRPQAVFDRRLADHIFGSLTLTWQAKQPIHIGSGFKDVIDGKVVRLQVRQGERPVLPGASLKGAVRARYEAITRSCVHGRPFRDGRQERITSRTFDGYTVELTPEVRNHKVFSDCHAPRGDGPPDLCPACALFGVMSRRSRVTFADVVTESPVVTESMYRQWGPRLHHCGDFVEESAARILRVGKLHGRKFHVGQGLKQGALQHVEAIPRGAILKARVGLFNVTPIEMGGLLTALGFLPESYLKAGGGKNLGFGRLAPIGAEWNLRDHLTKKRSHAAPHWRTAFEASPDRWASGEETLLRLHQGDC